MSTKKLAKELGLLRKRSQTSGGRKEPQLSNQIFSYLIVIDFESTCWREKNNYGQEIIEFPAVLLSTSSGEVEAEFHSFVLPQEHPVLSAFCTELTGITQSQVESGVPLQICLSRFSRWLQTLQLQKGVVFSRDPRADSSPSAAAAAPQKHSAFVTWSDWDLGVCLQYECKRKQLHKQEVLNSWIDLRATYKRFYSRKPKGLNGALQDLGIQFTGREHSGLDDARNTARLAWRMMKDGCVMKITRGPERGPLKTRPSFTNTAVNNRPVNNNNDNVNKGSTTASATSPHHTEPEPGGPRPSENPVVLRTEVEPLRNSRTLEPLKNRALVSPVTTLDALATPLCGGNSRPTRIGSVSVNNNISPHNNVNNNITSHYNNIYNNNNSFSSLVLVSTTVNSISHQPQLELTPDLEAVVGWEEEVPLLLDTEGGGSYDDVVLEEEEAGGTESEVWRTDEESVCQGGGGGGGGGEEGGGGGELVVTPERVMRPVSMTTNAALCSYSHLLEPSDTCSRSHTPSNTHTVKHTPSNTHTVKHTPSNTHTAKHTPSNTHTVKHTPSNTHTTKYTLSNTHTVKYTPSNTHTVKHTPSNTHTTKYTINNTHTDKYTLNNTHTLSNTHRPGRAIFNVYRDPPQLSTPVSSHFSHPTLPSSILSSSILSSSSTRPPSIRPPSSLNRSSLTLPSRSVAKITSPLCACGRRAKRQTVANGGPNHGRGFYCCPVRRSVGTATAGIRKKAGCEFFKWESALLKAAASSPWATAAKPPFNSALRHRPPPASFSSGRKSY